MPVGGTGMSAICIEAIVTASPDSARAGMNAARTRLGDGPHRGDHHGLTGTNRDRPGLREAPASRAGDTLVVTKLDCLGRSLPARVCTSIRFLTTRHAGRRGHRG